MSGAVRINRGFARLALAMAGLLILLSIGGFVVAGYTYVTAPNYRGWIAASSGNKIVLFPPDTPEATIKKAIPVIDALPEPSYSQKTVEYDPSWSQMSPPHDSKTLNVNWSDTRESVLASALDATLFGVACLIIAAILYGTIRTFGWVVAGFFD